MQSMRHFNHCITATALALTAGIVSAQETGIASGKSGLLAPANSFTLPIELDHDFGASNGDATIIRLLPLYSFSLDEDWRLVNLNVITIADAPGGVPGNPINPNPVEGDRVYGLSDLIHASFFTPEEQSAFIWGAGAIVSVPTATDDALGSEKWAAGPALRLTYRASPWNLGAVMGQRWSFAGESSRADINALMIRGTVRRQLTEKWHFVYAPIITANWDAPSSQRWVLPVGGGFGKTIDVGTEKWVASFQAYYNVLKPDGAPDAAIRFQVVAPVPGR